MQHAILNGESETGVTIMYMDRGMDTGDILLTRSLPISPLERMESLHDRMSALSCECILDALRQIEAGTAPRLPQDNTAATYAPMLTKEDGRVNWNSATQKIINQVRALDPWPGTFTMHDGKPLKIWDYAFVEFNEGKPGQVLEANQHLLVKTDDAALAIKSIQAQGGKRMPAGDYLRGHPISPGTILGEV